MLYSYAAILRDGRLEWESDPPPLPTDTAVRVQVTLLDPANAAPSGQRMAEALEKLAALGGLQSFGDPLAWQHEVRTDRVVPCRDP